MNIIVSSILDMFYPRLCTRCGAALTLPEKFLCTECVAGIPRTGFNDSSDNLAVSLFAGSVDVKHVYSWFFFTRRGSYGKLIYSLKYRGNKDLAKYLGSLYAMELVADKKLSDIDFIVPVPLHPSRLKKRGYNQSEVIADGISSVTGAALRTDILKRVLLTESQTRKSRYDRWKNMETAFFADNAAPNEAEAEILLVDDVMTTGATLIACIRALSKAGYSNISVLTLSIAENR